jgi:hypothetical protein
MTSKRRNEERERESCEEDRPIVELTIKENIGIKEWIKKLLQSTAD